MSDLEHRVNSVKPSRLEPLRDRSLAPFMRAPEITDSSVYWMPVGRYPVDTLQRRWQLTFCERLGAHLKESRGLREEVFLHFKTLYPDLLDRFSERAMDFGPMSGAAVTPGVSLAKTLEMDDLRRQVDAASRAGTLLDVNQWIPDYLYWFGKKKAVEQRQAFWGHGGILNLFVPPAPGGAPQVTLPRFMATAPGMSPDMAKRMQEDMAFAHSLRDPFLAASKQVFGERLRETPSYKGLLFALPFFSASALLGSGPEDRSKWFEVFSGYMVESRQDKGILLMLNEPEFDGELMDLLWQMGEDGHVYPE